MNRLTTTMAVMTVLATPAFAGGYDPASSIGAAHSEAFYTRAYARHGSDAYATAHQVSRPSVAVPAQPIGRNEQIRLDHAKGDF